jgi:FG-GAP repeat protein/VCBS repeat protein
MRPKHLCSLFVLGATCSMAVAATPAQQPHGGRVETLFEFDLGLPYAETRIPIASIGDVTGDGISDFVVGSADAEPSGLMNQGSVWLCSGVDGSVIHRWNGAAAEDHLGYSVAAAGDIDGDGIPDVLAGAPYSSPGGLSYAGFVVALSGAPPFGVVRQWNGLSMDSEFGHSVCSVGDIDGDLVPDLVIGAPLDSFDRGSASLYSGNLPPASGLIWKITGPSVYGTEFGAEVLGPGDLDGDGVPDVVIGAPEPERNGWRDEGQVHIYSGATGTLIDILYGEIDEDSFGESLATPGDIDGDGVNDLHIGAPQGGIYWWVGATYLYSGANRSLIHFTLGEHDIDMAGFVSETQDIDLDGIPDFLVGAPLLDNAGVSSGGVSVYSGASGKRIRQIDGHVPRALFGLNACAAGDLNSDGTPDLLVTAFESSSSLSGAVYAYSGAIVPQMSATASQLSAGSGGTIDFQMEFPSEAAFYAYQLLYSGAGTGPVSIQGLPVPLGYDLNLVNAYLGNYPGVFYNQVGMLDAQGDGVATLSAPAGGIPSSLIGQTFHFAAISRVVWGTWEYSSIALPVTIVP